MMNFDSSPILAILFLSVMNLILILTFKRVQTTYFRRRDATLDELRGYEGPPERTLSWANESALPPVIGLTLVFDLFFLIFNPAFQEASPDAMMVTSAVLVLGFMAIISLGTMYARVNLKHIHVIDQNGIQAFFAGRNGPVKVSHLDWQGVSHLKFLRTYRVPSPIGVKLIGGGTTIVLPSYLQGHRSMLSNLVRFSPENIRQSVLAEYGELMDDDGTWDPSSDEL